jgi:hypothetical protein
MAGVSSVFLLECEPLSNEGAAFDFSGSCRITRLPIDLLVGKARVRGLEFSNPITVQLNPILHSGTAQAGTDLHGIEIDSNSGFF